MLRCLRLAAACMAGHTLAPAQNFNRVSRVTDLHLLAHQLIRRAVVVPLQFHVIVEIHAGLLPLGKHERRRG